MRPKYRFDEDTGRWRNFKGQFVSETVVVFYCFSRDGGETNGQQKG